LKIAIEDLLLGVLDITSVKRDVIQHMTVNDD
jgi:hypothetical protein